MSGTNRGNVNNSNTSNKNNFNNDMACWNQDMNNPNQSYNSWNISLMPVDKFDMKYLGQEVSSGTVREEPSSSNFSGNSLPKRDQSPDMACRGSSENTLLMDLCQPPPNFSCSPHQNVIMHQFLPFPPRATNNPVAVIGSVPPPFSHLTFDTACSSVLPPTLNLSRPPPKFPLNEFEQSLQTWLENQSCVRTISKDALIIKKPTLTISDYKKKLMTFSNSLKELEKLHTHLQIMNKSLGDDEWLARKTEVENKKVAVEKAIYDLKMVPLSKVILLLNRRRSKRKRLKKKRKEYKEIKKGNKAFCQLEHSRIDMWLEKMKDLVERTRREEEIKKQADYVLSEVFHKKAEAKHMLTLLTTLGKLRNARIHDRESKGEFVSKEAAAAFNSIIENLKKRWLNQINGYNLEEQGLRVMLDDAEAKRSDVEKSLNKQILQQWTNIIFGVDFKNNPYQVTNIDKLIIVRRNWDRFIVDNEDYLLGSRIPNGWVLPTPPSDDAWHKCLKS